MLFPELPAWVGTCGKDHPCRRIRFVDNTCVDTVDTNVSTHSLVHEHVSDFDMYSAGVHWDRSAVALLNTIGRGHRQACYVREVLLPDTSQEH